ncbi:hypothetical protein REPUB_Repub07fG0060100 [Reevesia pubescens]
MKHGKILLSSCLLTPARKLKFASGLVSSNSRNDGEDQAKALEDAGDKMKVLEEGMKEFFPGGSPTIYGDNLGLLDIIISATFSSHKAYEEVLGAKILDPERSPLIFSWVNSLNELPRVKELLPPHDKLVALLKVIRQHALNFSSA